MQTSLEKKPLVNRSTVSTPIISAGLNCGNNFKPPKSKKIIAIEYRSRFSLFIMLAFSSKTNNVNEISSVHYVNWT